MNTQKQSAGVLLYKIEKEILKVFLVHPGGPFWKSKDNGAWSIPKGEPGNSEGLLDTAKREFAEETGTTLSGDFITLTPVKQRGGKIVHAWALEGDINPEKITPNTFTIQWPPHSNKMGTYPEIDKAGWFDIDEAKLKINQAQVLLLDELVKIKRG